MTSLSQKLQKTCRNLRNNDGDFFSKDDVLACKSISSDLSSVLQKEIQDFIFNNKGYDSDEWEKYKDRCRGKLDALKNDYNIENSNVYYNCLIGEDSNTFGEAVFGNRRNNHVKRNRDIYDKKKKEFDSLQKNIMESVARKEDNFNEDCGDGSKGEVCNKLGRLENLNKDIEENISDFKDRILKDYKDREDLQYDELLKNFRVIDVNNKIIHKMRDNISYINRKREIVTEKFAKTKKYYNIILTVLVVLVLVNLGLGGYYLYLSSKANN